MEHIGDVPLTGKQQNFISSMINMFGDGEHPMSDANTFKYFTIEYVKDIMNRDEVLNGLNPKGLETLTEIKQILADY